MSVTLDQLLCCWGECEADRGRCCASSMAASRRETLRAAGYAVVPVEASDEMCIAATARNDRGEDRDRDAYGLYRTIYRAMIAATKEPGS